MSHSLRLWMVCYRHLQSLIRRENKPSSTISQPMHSERTLEESFRLLLELSNSMEWELQRMLKSYPLQRNTINSALNDLIKLENCLGFAYESSQPAPRHPFPSQSLEIRLGQIRRTRMLSIPDHLV